MTYLLDKSMITLNTEVLEQHTDDARTTHR